MRSPWGSGEAATKQQLPADQLPFGLLLKDNPAGFKGTAGSHTERNMLEGIAQQAMGAVVTDLAANGRSDLAEKIQREGYTAAYGSMTPEDQAAVDGARGKVKGDVRILLAPPEENDKAIFTCPSCNMAVRSFKALFPGANIQVFGQDKHGNVTPNLNPVLGETPKELVGGINPKQGNVKLPTGESGAPLGTPR